MKKVLTIPALILLLAAGCNQSQPQQSVSQPIRSPVSQPAQNHLEQPTPTPKARPPITPSLSPVSGNLPIAIIATSSKLNTHEFGNLSITQIVDGSSIPQIAYHVTLGETAFDLLNTSHKVTAKDYGSGMGEFVESIDGVAADGQHFWEFYVDGKSSNVGASTYKLTDGDKVEWKLSEINSSAQ